MEQILKKIETDEVQHANFEVWKEKGDILASSLFQIKKGQDSCEAFDFYHNEMTSIPLDPRKTPQENLEYYYKKYNKAKTTLVYARNGKRKCKRSFPI
ncbi:Fibronectin-binding protein A N-terminus (FbpA) [Fusobacterium necrophorum subsp. necrophorum]|nr:Fibronectin-binding protein A N-terminus (FbpA) [Fusobacterium necrophorum subsp. necrophorum]